MKTSTFLDQNFDFTITPLNIMVPGKNTLTFRVSYTCSKLQSRNTIAFTIKTDKNTINIKYLVECGLPNHQVFHPSMIFLVLFSTFFVYVSTWSIKPIMMDQEEFQEGDFNVYQALIFFAGGSIMMVLIFFFSTAMNYLIMFVATLTSFCSVCIVLYMVCEMIMSKEFNETPKVGQATGADLVAIFGSFLVVGYWFLMRSWIFNNIICACIGYVVLRLINVPNFKVVLALYLLMFVFDIFWVFLS